MRARKKFATLVATFGIALTGIQFAASQASAQPVPTASIRSGDASGWIADSQLAHAPTWLLSALIRNRSSLPAPLAAEVARISTSSAANSPDGPDAAVVPYTALDVCQDSVCMDVYGSGLTVNSIWTYAYGNVGCQNPFFDIFNFQPGGWPGDHGEGPLVCPYNEQPGVYYGKFTTAQYGMPFTVPSNQAPARAESSWSLSIGSPTADIHS